MNLATHSNYLGNSDCMPCLKLTLEVSIAIVLEWDRSGKFQVSRIFKGDSGAIKVENHCHNLIQHFLLQRKPSQRDESQGHRASTEPGFEPRNRLCLFLFLENIYIYLKMPC